MGVAFAIVLAIVMVSLANYLGQWATDWDALLGEPEAITHHIAKQGRIEISAEEVSEMDALRITLEFPSAWQGESPSPIRVVAGDGRSIELLASKAIDEQELLVVALDTDELEPGPYMIEVRSAEATPLQLRRYVFEIR